jgi:hypothetical protein
MAASHNTLETLMEGLTNTVAALPSSAHTIRSTNTGISKNNDDSSSNTKNNSNNSSSRNYREMAGKLVKGVARSSEQENYATQAENYNMLAEKEALQGEKDALFEERGGLLAEAMASHEGYRFMHFLFFIPFTFILFFIFFLCFQFSITEFVSSDFEVLASFNSNTYF